MIRSRVLHRLRVLGIAGFRQSGGTDFLRRDDMTHPREDWTIGWRPEFDASLVESAVHGATLAEASASRLLEQALAAERGGSEAAARCLLDAVRMGATDLLPTLTQPLTRRIHAEPDFVALARALGHLLYLFRYDDALGSTGVPGIGVLLTDAFDRGLWLLDGRGGIGGSDRDLMHSVSALVETYERCAHDVLADRRDGLLATLRRVASDSAQGAALRGAASGALWVLGAADVAVVLGQVREFADPDHLGDFLGGVFTLARENVRRQPELLLSVDKLIAEFDDEAFLVSLPPLRLAFSTFTPREKHYMAVTLLEAHASAGTGAAAPRTLAPLTVDSITAARVLALEGRVLRTLTEYGIRVWPEPGPGPAI